MELFVPITPRKILGWLSACQLLLISACLGCSAYLVAAEVLPPFSITSIVLTCVAFCCALIGIIATSLDHPQLYFAYKILSILITIFNMLVLAYFTYVAIDHSLNNLSKPLQMRWNSQNEEFNPMVGVVAAAFASEMSLFICSSFYTSQARRNALYRIQNEEIDALLQEHDDFDDNHSQSSYHIQVRSQNQFLNNSRLEDSIASSH
ncbi:Oidioi.mRNA.OKI2018_I69.PAR.g8863.t1.cds [Oikopleura dioica]|uniref:Oidioi.mRNA.OKI2018_I69.PAR.g8863.t1.cds n=1 Tax=Oikopleura dioica TaxID=34765 RepID=A0ABN7RI20_OIKDI|nr:Oidioi.mRNA.OKI2018_I69.PAR.g8863.t1.cds [Oikopleura dioica]